MGTVAVQRDRRPRGFDPAVEESLSEESPSAATVTRMRYGMATHSCTSVGVQRFEWTSSWLYVPLIRAALYMDTAHGVEGDYDASNYVGDYVWTRIVHLVRADFVLRGIIANDVQVSGPNGYIAAGIQERLLHSPQNPFPGESRYPEEHDLFTVLNLCAAIARQPHLHDAASVRAAIVIQIQHLTDF